MKDSGQVARMSVSRTQLVSGPLPPPEAMERYERAHPGTAERIVAMAERELETRQKIALIDAQKSADDARRARFETRTGQVLSFVLTLAAFAVAAYCAKVNATKIGVTVAGVTLVSVVSTLVNRRR